MNAAQGAQIYEGDGYSLVIPSGFIYSRRTDLGTNYETWHSSDNTELVVVQWEADSPASRIRATEEGNIAVNKRGSPPIPVLYPTIKGSKSAAMFEKHLPSPEFSGTYLFVIAINGNIYEIDGIAFSSAADTSVKQVVQSFSPTIKTNLQTNN